jgi:hypothetical protein
MFGGVVDSAFGPAYKAAQRRAIDYTAASLLPHLLKFELHATPDTAEVDSHHSVVVFRRGISRIRKDILNAGVVVGCIEVPKGRDRLMNHRFHLSVVGNVATDGKCFMASGH